MRTVEEARLVVRSIDQSTSDPSTKLASRLLALTGKRPGLVNKASWTEFEGVDWENPEALAPDALWRVPASRMKLVLRDKNDEAFEHVIPLPPEAVDVLRQQRRLTGRFEHAFGQVRALRR